MAGTTVPNLGSKRNDFEPGTAILALDLGATTGWALQGTDGTITSGAVEFRPGRFDGGGVRFLRFKAWLLEISTLAGGIALVAFEEVRNHAGVDAAHAAGILEHLGWTRLPPGLKNKQYWGPPLTLTHSDALAQKLLKGVLGCIDGDVYGRMGYQRSVHVRQCVSASAAHAYGGWLATLTAWCEVRAIPYTGITVGTIKRHATGKGNAGKDAAIAAMRAKGHAPADDNEADALAILYCTLAQGLGGQS